MAVTDVTNTVQEAGNDVKTAFTFDFKVFQASDLEVFEVDQTTLAATMLTITTDYTVSLNTITEGGTITYVTAPATGKDSFIKRKLTLTQATDVDTEESIPSQSLNNEYDRSRMIDIQQQEELDRSIKFAETSSLTDVVFPESTSAAARASKIPAWDSTGLVLELLSVNSVVSTDPIAVQGDLVQGNSAGVAEKLAIGATSTVLQVVAGKAAWVVGTGTGIPVLKTSPTIETPTITVPVIASFASAAHNHTNAAGGGLVLTQYIKLHDSKASNTDGGTFTQDAWQKRTVTEANDVGDNVSVASSVITLEAGTYDFFIRCPANKVDLHQARLRNTSDTSTVLAGSNARTSAADGVESSSVIRGRFTIAAQKTFEIQHFCSTTKTTDGFGNANNFGEVEIYTVAEFWKIID